MSQKDGFDSNYDDLFGHTSGSNDFNLDKEFPDNSRQRDLGHDFEKTTPSKGRERIKKGGNSFILSALVAVVGISLCCAIGILAYKSTASDKTSLLSSTPIISEDVTTGIPLEPESPILASLDSKITLDEKINYFDPLNLFSDDDSISDISVSGIVLDKTIEALTHLSDIVGATYDEQSQQLIIIGKEDPSMPDIDFDHFAVALRGIFQEGRLGVSIDRPESMNSKVMPVKYLGLSENTQFGMIMFEADRVLKTYSLGEDNITQKEITTKVPDFAPMPVLSHHFNSGEKGENWCRFWFVPDSLGLKVSEDKSTVCFVGDRLNIKTEYDMPGVKNPGTDPAADYFAKFFTRYYHEFAAEQKILKELFQLGKIVCLVRWIKDANLPIDSALFNFDYRIRQVKTPDTTPMITTSYAYTTSSTYRKIIHTYFTTGGVDFQVENKYYQDDGESKNIGKEAIKSRPSQDIINWNFTLNNQQYCTTALSIQKTKRKGNYSVIHADYLSSNRRGCLNLDAVRIFNSFNPTHTLFGHSWTLTPYRIFIPNPDLAKKIGDKRFYNEVVLLHPCSGRGYEFKHMYEAKPGGRHYYYNTETGMKIDQNADGSFTMDLNENARLIFDKEGKLVLMRASDGSEMQCEYANDKLIRLFNSKEELIIRYDPQGRVEQIECPDGSKRFYYYRPDGNLFKVQDTNGNYFFYEYDNYHRVIGIKNNDRDIILAGGYNAYGQIRPAEIWSGDNLPKELAELGIKELIRTNLEREKIIEIHEGGKILCDTSVEMKEISGYIKDIPSYKKLILPRMPKDIGVSMKHVGRQGEYIITLQENNIVRIDVSQQIAKVKELREGYEYALKNSAETLKNPPKAIIELGKILKEIVEDAGGKRRILLKDIFDDVGINPTLVWKLSYPSISKIFIVDKPEIIEAIENLENMVIPTPESSCLLISLPMNKERFDINESLSSKIDWATYENMMVKRLKELIDSAKNKQVTVYTEVRRDKFIDILKNDRFTYITFIGYNQDGGIEMADGVWEFRDIENLLKETNLDKDYAINLIVNHGAELSKLFVRYGKARLAIFSFEELTIPTTTELYLKSISKFDKETTLDYLLNETIREYINEFRSKKTDGENKLPLELKGISMFRSKLFLDWESEDLRLAA